MSNERCKICGRKAPVKCEARRELRRQAAGEARVEAVDVVAERLGHSDTYVVRACKEFGVTPIRHRAAPLGSLAYKVIAALQNTDLGLAAIGRDLEVSHARISQIRNAATKEGVLFLGRDGLATGTGMTNEEAVTLLLAYPPETKVVLFMDKKAT